MTTTRDLSYQADLECIGHLALPEGAGPHPGVLVIPAFRGLGPQEKAVAERLAGLGYAALGVDYYGGGKLAADTDEAMDWMSGIQSDRPRFAARLKAALDALGALDEVDATRLAAVGYCLGGKGVLDLARSGADFRAGISFHGVYDAPPEGSVEMKAALLILHGWDDPLCPPDATVALAEELTAHCADWQILAFGHTGHGFTSPSANAPGKAYSESASTRGWAAMESLLSEKLA